MISITKKSKIKILSYIIRENFFSPLILFTHFSMFTRIKILKNLIYLKPIKIMVVGSQYLQK